MFKNYQQLLVITHCHRYWKSSNDPKNVTRKISCFNGASEFLFLKKIKGACHFVFHVAQFQKIFYLFISSKEIFGPSSKLLVLMLYKSLVQFINVYEPKFETAGKFWPIVHNSMIFSLVLMHCIAVGIFTLKKVSLASTLIFPLPILTLLFNEYCRKRFRPIFIAYSAEVCLQVTIMSHHMPKDQVFLFLPPTPLLSLDFFSLSQLTLTLRLVFVLTEFDKEG